MTDIIPNTEYPMYDSCRPCAKLNRVKTQIGEGYGCPVCQMTYIQTSKGAFIPFDQAYKLMVKKRQQTEARTLQEQRRRAKPPKQQKKKKKRKKVRR